MSSTVWMQSLADTRALGALLERLRSDVGPYELLHHWKQGEFHHDVVVHVVPPLGPNLPGAFLVVATNCNGGVKELLCFDELPTRGGLWHWRCPASLEFAGELPPIRARVTTEHFFDPCELLGADARSELKAEHRQRQTGGGWEPVTSKPDRA